jgi:hypothetical protein
LLLARMNARRHASVDALTRHTDRLRQEKRNPQDAV